jgi:hypothetical protein
MSLDKLANEIASKGRYGDTELVHMTRGEVDGLHGLARAMYGRDLPVNPETGLHEASWLKKLLPTLAGAAASYFGGPIWGAVAGGITGAATNKERGLGALTGAASGWAAGQGLAGLQSAGATARGMTPGSPGEMSLGSLWEGAKALGTEEGRNAFVGSASQAATDKTPFKPSVGLGGDTRTVLGAALASQMMADPVEAQGQGQGGGTRTPIKTKHTSGEWYVDPYGVNRFRYLAAAGGEVPGYAPGGTPRGASGRNAGTSTSGQTGASKDMLEYLFGRKDLERTVAPAAKFERERGPEKLDIDIGVGGGAVDGVRDTINLPVNNAEVIGVDTGGGGYEHGGGTFDSPDDVDISVPGGQGFAGSEWIDPDTAQPGLGNSGAGIVDRIIDYGVGDPGNASGSNLTPTGERISDLAGDYEQFKYDHPGLTEAASWAAYLAGTAGLAGKIAGGIGENVMNRDETNVHGKNAVNGLDKDSDVAHQAAADAQEMDRFVNRVGSMEPTSSADDYRNEMDKASDAYSGWNNTEQAITGVDDSGLGEDIPAMPDMGFDSSDAGGWNSNFDSSFSGLSGNSEMDSLERYENALMREGGVVPLQSGGFVFPADFVSIIGAGSSGAGLEALAKRFGARPVKGKGHGQSDDVHATIDGRQPARVARDEAVLNAKQVAAIGGGDPKQGAKKLYAMMQRVRKQATGSPKQMRVIDANKELA